MKPKILERVAPADLNIQTREGWPLLTVETRDTREWPLLKPERLERGSPLLTVELERLERGGPLLTVETRETRHGWSLLTVK